MVRSPIVKEEDVSAMSIDADSRKPSPLVTASVSSASATPKRDVSLPPQSASETPTSGTPIRKNASSKPAPQLIGHLPKAEEEARRTFGELDDNVYQYGTLGRSREALESMTCDCQYVPGQFFSFDDITGLR
jgi:histone-lysine N-methyltransferase SETD2